MKMVFVTIVVTIKNELKGKDSFAKIVNKYNDKKNKYSCLVPLSGGRDSCFTLHYIKTELGLNLWPIHMIYFMD